MWREYTPPAELPIPCGPPTHPIESHPIPLPPQDENRLFEFQQPDDIAKSRPLRLYCDFDLVYSFLTFPEFTCVKEAHDADVVWCNSMILPSSLLPNQVRQPITSALIIT